MSDVNIAAHDDAAPVVPPATDPSPNGGDGSVVVRLVTEFGEADITVPPQAKWRSSARHALFTNGDDLGWARSVLSETDMKAWLDLDPTQDEMEAFFRAWGRATGNRAARRSRT